VEAARPPSEALGALLEAASHGLRTLSGGCLKQLPRMADFALWATACETVLWPAGTFMRAHDENRRTAIEGVIEAAPVADHVRDMMAKATTWTRKRVGPLSDRCRSFAGWMEFRLAEITASVRLAGCVASRPRFGRSASAVIPRKGT
jgi:hypothetical protein